MYELSEVPALTAKTNARVDAATRRRTAVLVVDDEPGIRSFLQRALAKDYGLVEAVDSVEAAEALRARCRFDILVVDISLPGQSGLEWIDNLRRGGDRTGVIFITAYADLNATIGALRVGAADFILKPFRVEQLSVALDRCIEHCVAPQRGVADPAAADLGASELLGDSDAMREALRLLRLVAPTPSSVLIDGETGTGKELAAAAIHRYSGRHGPFVALNCVAIAPELFESELFGHTKGAFTGAHQSREGLFSAAHGGTLFLDELSELPAAMQAKLLRVLESRRIRPVGADREINVDVRLVAATNRDLGQAVRAGAFREDLYFRLNVVNLHMPALRERAGDIPQLLEYFSRRLSADLGVAPYPFTAAELARLQGYAWPGNVRELKNVIERTLLLGRPPWETLGGAPPPETPAAEAVAAGFPLTWTLDQVEQEHTRHVLHEAHGNKSEAARRLGISRKTLERKLSSWTETREPASLS
jgi:DNA-binding NtrC family response regulator